MATQGSVARDAYLRKVSLSLTNAQEPGIKEPIARMGMNEGALAAGAGLLQRATDTSNQKESIYGDYHTAVDQVAELTQQLRLELQGLRAIAGLALRGTPDLLASLKLSAAIAKAPGRLISTAEQLLVNRNASPVIMEQFAHHGFDDDRFAVIAGLTASLKQTAARQTALKGDAQQTTRDLDALMTELRAWYGTFTRVARIALSGQPELLEKLGILVKPRRKSKPASPATVPTLS